MLYSGANSSQVVQDGQRSTKAVPHTSTLLLVGLLVAAFVVGGLGTFAVLRVRAPRAQAAAPTVSSARITPALVEASTSVPVEALPPPAVAPTTTLVSFPRSTISHRVWIDGALVGDDRQPIETKCGAHAIKIGSQGKLRRLDLPCGQPFVID